MNITLIAPTFKRNDICNRLINSVPDWINIIIVSLSDSENIIKKENVIIIGAEQMPLSNALNLGVRLADNYYPETEAYLLTDDDVYFTKDTIIKDNIFDLLKKKDTGLVGITRIINSVKLENRHIISPHVYKGGGWFIRKEVFHAIGGFTNNNSADEWDICIKSYVNGYVNYRTKSCYAYHKQATATGGYKSAIAESKSLGLVNNYMFKYVSKHIQNVAKYENLSGKKTKFNLYAKTLHSQNNKKLKE